MLHGIQNKIAPVMINYALHEILQLQNASREIEGSMEGLKSMILIECLFQGYMDILLKSWYTKNRYPLHSRRQCAVKGRKIWLIHWDLNKMADILQTKYILMIFTQISLRMFLGVCLTLSWYFYALKLVTPEANYHKVENEAARKPLSE